MEYQIDPITGEILQDDLALQIESKEQRVEWLKQLHVDFKELEGKRLHAKQEIDRLKGKICRYDERLKTKERAAAKLLKELGVSSYDDGVVDIRTRKKRGKIEIDETKIDENEIVKFKKVKQVESFDKVALFEHLKKGGNINGVFLVGEGELSVNFK